MATPQNISNVRPSESASPASQAADATRTGATSRSATTTGAATHGKTVIEDSVVAKVAGIAVRDIAGVYALGGGVARMMGAVRDAVGNTDLARGISVEVGETQVAADVSIVAEYPVPLQDLGDRVRAAVSRAVTELIGMEIAEVNVTITDVHVPTDDDDQVATSGQEDESRVR